MCTVFHPSARRAGEKRLCIYEYVWRDGARVINILARVRRRRRQRWVRTRRRSRMANPFSVFKHYPIRANKSLKSVFSGKWMAPSNVRIDISINHSHNPNIQQRCAVDETKTDTDMTAHKRTFLLMQRQVEHKHAVCNFSYLHREYCISDVFTIAITAREHRHTHTHI